MTSFNKFKKPCFWPIFPIRLWKILLSCITSNGFLAPCQNLEKTNDTIPKHRPDRRTDRSYFIGPFRLPPGVQNRAIVGTLKIVVKNVISELADV